LFVEVAKVIWCNFGLHYYGQWIGIIGVWFEFDFDSTKQLWALLKINIITGGKSLECSMKVNWTLHLTLSISRLLLYDKITNEMAMTNDTSYK
jgi:hypothetical protein